MTELSEESKTLSETLWWVESWASRQTVSHVVNAKEKFLKNIRNATPLDSKLLYCWCGECMNGLDGRWN